MNNTSIIHQHISWINNELADLTDAIRPLKSVDLYGSLEWPVSTIKVMAEDVVSTANYLAGPYESVESVCALVSLDDFLNRSQDLNYFFGRIHVLGHLIIEKIKPGLDHDNLSDIAYIEIARTNCSNLLLSNVDFIFPTTRICNIYKDVCFLWTCKRY